MKKIKMTIKVFVYAHNNRVYLDIQIELIVCVRCARWKPEQQRGKEIGKSRRNHQGILGPEHLSAVGKLAQ